MLVAKKEVVKIDVANKKPLIRKNQYGQYLKDVLDGKYVDKLHE